MAYQKPKGTVDYYPEEKEVQNLIFSRLLDIAKRYNYLQIESPVFEQMDLLIAKSGEEIKTQIFNLEKKGSEEFGLRFDITVSAARMFIEKQKELSKPVKWCYASRMWRYERPQKGRLREFYQFGTECFGTDSPESDAEQINLIIDALLSLGLKKTDFVVKLNNRNLLEGILQEFVKKDSIPDLIRLIDKKAKISEDSFNLTADDLGVKDIDALKAVLSIDNIKKLEKLELNDLAKDGLGDMKEVYELLPKDVVKIDLFTARGLAYYTGTVFEVFDIEEKYRSIAGGGRYDKLVGLLKGQECPAVGFGLGTETLMLLLQSRDLVPKVDLGPDYFVAVVDDKLKKQALDIIYKLRKKYSVDFDLSGRNLSNQIKYANSIDAKNLIVIGENELKTGKVKVKDLVSGTEQEKGLDKL